MNNLKDIFSNYKDDKNTFINYLNDIDFTVNDIINNKKHAKDDWIVEQAYNKLIKTDISVLPYVNEYKHKLFKTTVNNKITNFHKNRIVRIGNDKPLKELINEILGVDSVNDIDIKFLSKKFNIRFIIIHNVISTNINFISDKLYNQSINYTVGVNEDIINKTETIIVNPNNDETNISIEVINETNNDNETKDILLETVNDKTFYKLQTYNLDKANLNLPELIEKKNKLYNEMIEEQVIYFDYIPVIKNNYNIDYKHLTDYIVKNISKDNTAETIVQLVTEYICRNINIHKNEIRCLLSLELLKFKRIIEIKIINILKSNKSQIEKDILISNELMKILKNIKSFNNIYFREQFIKNYIN